MRALAILVLIGAAPRIADACAPAPPAGLRVAIAEEEAVIVWDESRKVEHFIRRAAFRTDAQDFGFLVPTPAQPELAEADDQVFDRLEQTIRPEVRYQTVKDVSVGCYSLMMRASKEGASVAAGPPVRVLAEQRVAGLDAVVLEADDAAALGDWLRARGYPFRPELTEWVAPYVANKWKITAFKLARREGATIATRAVRMSFPTERPIFPYREPSDSGGDGARSLRLFVVGPARMVAAGWNASVEYAAPVLHLPMLLGGAAPAGSVPDGAWLTAYLDRAATRAPEDLSFAADRAAPAVIPPPVVIARHETVPIPLEILWVIAPVGAYYLMRRRRRRRGTEHE